jgi:hypothetical protein
MVGAPRDTALHGIVPRAIAPRARGGNRGSTQ